MALRWIKLLIWKLSKPHFLDFVHCVGCLYPRGRAHRNYSAAIDKWKRCRPA
jgi:hypothetical protein